MRLTSIETTPNPNSMKLNLDTQVGTPATCTPESPGSCPEALRPLLQIEGVKSLYLCHDFATLTRDPRADWLPILDAVARVLSGDESDAPVKEKRRSGEKLGQAAVLVQTFKGIPIQVKVTDEHGEKRIALPDRFAHAARRIQDACGADYLKERYWADHGVRYGSADEIAREVAEEIEGTMDQSEIARLVAVATGEPVKAPTRRSHKALAGDLASNDWRHRLKAVQELSTVGDATDLLTAALKDENHQVRRLAAAALGASAEPAAVGPLCEALLNDASVGVRRTAGDALSDLGDESAEPAVCAALKDANKLVRWRAARFLSDLGTAGALPYLRQAADELEFEVRLEIEAAIERISGGKEGSLPAWKKIVQGSPD